jgi:hypothetical protein
MKGGKAGRDRPGASAAKRAAGGRGKPKKGGPPRPGTGAPKKGSRKQKGFGATSSSGEE